MNTHDPRSDREHDGEELTTQEIPNREPNMEDLDESDPINDALGATLRAALAPQTDVRSNARRKVDRALHVRSAASLLTSMGGCGIETIRHLLTNPVRSADRYPMSEMHPLADFGADDSTHVPGGKRPGAAGPDRQPDDSGGPR